MNRLDQIINDIANEQVPEEQVEQAADRVRRNLFTYTVARPVLIRTCADYQAIIPAYLNKTLSAARALLLQDHARECVACRHALDRARAGSAPTLARPGAPASRTIRAGWAVAAAAAVIAVAGAMVVVRNLGGIGNGRAVIQTVIGILYAVNDSGSTPVFPGREIADGERVRTAKGSTAMVRLADGSLVEMNERTELSFSRSARGIDVRLDRGGVIVQAAKQRRGSLDVLTPDCTVSVKGTIFAVERGTKASRVSVAEGAVQVRQGASSRVLKPGEQLATDPSVAGATVDQAFAWSRDSARYLALLGDLSEIKKGLDAMPSPGLRHDSKLLAYIDPATVLYAAIPNLGATIAEGRRLFDERLRQSEVLRAWWQEQQDGPKLEEMLQRLRNFSDYLGDEIVLSVSGDPEGKYSAPMLLAEVKRPGLEAFLRSEFAAQGRGDAPQILALEPPRPDSARAYYYKPRRAAPEDRRMLVGINDKVVAIAWDQAQLDAAARRIAGEPDGGAPNSVIAQAREAYTRGVNYLLCVDMEHIARNLVAKQKSQTMLSATGLERMRYLTVERKDVGGRVENSATLAFAGPRNGMAAWLAEPSPMGSLDFVSPNAALAISIALREPRWMLNDIFRSIAEQDPQFNEKLARFRRDEAIALSLALGEPLGGEFTFAIDGPVLPLPSWKLIAEVYSPDRMQWAIEQLIKFVNQDSTCTDCGLRLTREDSGGRTWYTITNNKVAYEIDYTYADGYLIAAPGRSLLTRAIQNRDTGYVLSRSDAFRSQLPRDGSLNFSALAYYNAGPALASIAGMLNGVSGSEQQSIKLLAANSGPGLIYAYGRPDSITVSSAGSFFGLDLNTLAIPAVLKNMMLNQREGK